MGLSEHGLICTASPSAQGRLVTSLLTAGRDTARAKGYVQLWDEFQPQSPVLGPSLITSPQHMAWILLALQQVLVGRPFPHRR